MSETLDERYARLCRTPWNIHEHLPTLRALAQDCGHVTELGTERRFSTTAFLAAQPADLVCVDVMHHPLLADLRALGDAPVVGRRSFDTRIGATRWRYTVAESTSVVLEPTDLLFIDTRHTYAQLTAELGLHAAHARRWIVLHDTVTNGLVGEEPGTEGIGRAVDEFLALGDFVVHAHHANNNGLTVLRRV